MKNIMVVYAGGYHGEFFIGNIVSNTDKFHYYFFKCRSEELNAYRYESIEQRENSPLIAEIQTTDDIDYHSVWNGKPIITRTHNHIAMQTMPSVRLFTADPMYHRRAVLLRCIKTLDKTYSNVNGVPDTAYRNGFRKFPNVMNHTTSDSMLYVDIKEWLHNENLEKIEDFFQIKYTQAMKNAVTIYHQRDEILINRYFKNWQEYNSTYLIKEMKRIDKEFQFYG
jgi:hypothetical protein